MEQKEILSKLKPVIIVLLLFSLAFFIRAEAVNISGVPDQMKSYFQEENGLPYFSEMDSYYNFRMTQDYLDHGYLGDTKKDGINWDLHSFYPPGRSAEYPPMIVYVTAFLYKLANIFGQVPLLVVCFWTTALIASLCVIPAYFFVRGITNDYGGIAAAIIVGLSPFYLSHTFAGFFDTDMFNMLLPLLIVWFFSLGITTTETRKKIIFSVLAALSMVIFSLSWEGWWYIFYILVFATIAFILLSKYIFKIETSKSWAEYSEKSQWLKDQPVILPLIIFVVLSVVFIFMAWGTGAIGSFLGPFSAAQIQSSTQAATQYPNVFISVGELQIPDIGTVIGDVGGILPFAFGMLGAVLLFWLIISNGSKSKKKAKSGKKPPKKYRKRAKKARKFKEEPEEEPEEYIQLTAPDKKKNYLYYLTLLIVWFVVTAYAFTKGVRFVEAFALPVGLSAGIFVGLLKDYLTNYIRTPTWRTITMIFVVIVVCAQPVYVAYATSNSVVPGTDDAMVNSMNWIKANTPNNTIITSWWDFGHLFTAKADRAVTFDGGSQNNGRAYWVGKALLTSNEDLSAGILRMLASSGDDGYIALENYTKNTAKSVEILDKILPVDKTNANTILTTQYGLTSEQAQNVLKYTHPDNPTPDVFITSLDMAGKAGWWSYFGNWNFNNKSSTNYIYSVAQANATTNNNSVLIQGQNGVVAQITGNNITAGIMVDENRMAEPHRFIIVDNGTKAYDQVINNQSTFSILLVKQDNNLIAVAVTRELEDSMFTRLFFMQGDGLKRFKLVKKEPAEGISEVMVWNVNY